MATNFTEGHPGVAPKQFKPGPGQTGVAAAMHQPRGKGERRGTSGSSPSKRDKIGAPAQEAPTEPAPDTTHLMMAIEHYAIQSLGRDVPLPLWRQHNGANEEAYYDYLSHGNQ